MSVEGSVKTRTKSIRGDGSGGIHFHRGEKKRRDYGFLLDAVATFRPPLVSGKKKNELSETLRHLAVFNIQRCDISAAAGSLYVAAACINCLYKETV